VDRIGALVVVPISMAGCSCGAEQLDEGAAGGGADAGLGSQASGIAVIAQSGTVASVTVGPHEERCREPPVPRGLPEGWKAYTHGMCPCDVYVPVSADDLPSPPKWTACPPSSKPIDCQVMVLDWDGAVAFGMTSFGRDAAGKPLITFERTFRGEPLDYSIDLITEPDGPVRSAMMRLGFPQPACNLYPECLTEGSFLFKIKNPDVGSWADRYAVGGAVEDLTPAVVEHFHDDLPRSWTCSGKRIARLGLDSKLFVRGWSASSEELVHAVSLDPEKLHATQMVMRGDALFFTVTNSFQRGIMLWDPTGGTRALVRWSDDATRGAADIGTDGVDLVWTEAEGKAPDTSEYSLMWIATAPFTTDAASLQSRRLRHVKVVTGTWRWMVGCGYATNQEVGNAVIIVRLADGMLWRLPLEGPSLEPTLPMGLTCDEIFATGLVGGQVNVVRIKLASLGPGEPAEAQGGGASP
jgi:hypothetical protein